MYKTLEHFGADKRTPSKLRPECKECRTRLYDPKKKSAYNKIYYNELREKIITQASKWTKKNRKHVVKYKISYIQKRSKIDPAYRIMISLRARLRSALKNNLKKGSTIRDLGCSVEFLKKYLESKFYNDMTWNNYGAGKNTWQIDHIIPLRKFDLTDIVQFKQAVHYSNLQPLWYKDHIVKTKKDRQL